jgi:hypothetical protein
MHCAAGSAGIRQAPFTELLCVQGSESWTISVRGELTSLRSFAPHTLD